MTADFDTIREALQLHILGAASLNDWKIASDALARVQAAAEQAEKALAEARDWIFESYEPETALTPDYQVQLLNRLDAALAGQQLLSSVASPDGAVTPAGSSPGVKGIALPDDTGAATQDDVIGAMQRGMTCLFERLALVQAAADEAEKALAFVLGHDGRLNPVWQLGARQSWQEWSDAKNKVREAGAALSVLRGKDTA